MMFGKKLIVAVMFIVLFAAVSCVDAADNSTVEVTSSDYEDVLNVENTQVLGDGEIIREDIYFDASQSVDGNGSKESPYNYVGYGRVTSNSNLHFKDGDYWVGYAGSVSNVSFYGENPHSTTLDFQNELLHAHGSVLVNNITFKQSLIYVYDNFTASNSIFDGNHSMNIHSVIQTMINLDGHEILLDNCSFINNYGAEDSVIRLEDSNAIISNCRFIDNYVDSYGVVSGQFSSLNISNTSFKNNRANSLAGAIYIGGELSVFNCTFINNSAFCGGSIYSYKSSKVLINDSRFFNNNALVGGDLLVYESEEICMDNCDFTNSSSTMGGALSVFGSDLNISHCNFENNLANNGASIYQGYGYLKLSDSTFVGNDAKEDGTIFSFSIEGANLTNNYFMSNRGHAIICDSENLILQNNNLAENDVFLNFKRNLFIGSGNYILLRGNDTFDGNIPEKYDPRDYGLITDLRPQGRMGYCWIFGTIATLESCILKSTGVKFDFSEMNVANIVSKYSFGFHDREGGVSRSAIAYLLNWFGPVNEDDDIYSENKPISPIFNSLFHIHNVMYLPKYNSSDLDLIKEVILRYGAVGLDICFTGDYFNGSSYYNPNNDSINHCVSIVGWDDNYPKENFKILPPADGAWIIKNSWDEADGNGCYYVSYYDTTIGPDDEAMFTFIFDDKIRLDKNYQYDFAETLRGILLNSSVCYKNVYNSTDDEYLAAVSTYFHEEYDWKVFIYVNDELVHTQSGRNGHGYYTINLDKYIPLKKNDVFEVMFNLTSDEDWVYYPLMNYKFGDSKGKSFIYSQDGGWIDFYEYHNHSDVSCIKAYTFLNKINTNITLIVDYDDYNPVNITAYLTDEYGNRITSGIVIFDLAGEKYTVNVSNGESNIIHVFKKGSNLITASFSGDGYESSFASQSIDVLTIEVNADLEISTHLDTATINVSTSRDVVGNGIIHIANKSYIINLTDGFATLTVTDLENNNYTAYFELENKTYECGVSKNFTVSFLKAEIIANNFTTYVYSNDKYVIVLKDALSFLSGKNVFFKIDGKQIITTTGDNGQAELNVNLTSGTYPVEVRFGGDSEHPSCHVNATITVSKMDSTINVSYNQVDYGNTLHILVKLNVGGDVELVLNNKAYLAKTSNKTAEFNISDLDAGEYEFNIAFAGNIIYSQASVAGSVRISKITPEVIVTAEDIEYMQSETITVKVNATGSVELSLDNISQIEVIDNGVATFSISGLSAGHYDASVKYLGDINHNVRSSSTSFDVSKATPGIVILANDMMCGGSGFITVYIDAPGSIELSLGNVSLTEVIVDGEACFTVEGLPGGYYDVTARYLGDINYNENVAESTFYVVKFTPEVNVSASDTVYGDAVVVTVRVNATGCVELSCGDVLLSDVLSDGEVTFDVVGLSAGHYDVDVKYLGDESHNMNFASVGFNISPITPEVSVFVGDVVYGDAVVVTVRVNTTGCVELSCGDVLLSDVLSDGEVTFDVVGLSAGHYDVAARYLGDINHNENVGENTFDVLKATPEVSVFVGDAVVGHPAIVNITVDGGATGNVVVSVNGCENVVVISDGKGSLIVSDLAVGTYSVSARYIGDDNFNSSEMVVSFKVVDNGGSCGNVSLIVPEMTVSEFADGTSRVTLPSDATGQVTLTIGSKNYMFGVVNGIADVVLPELADGDYAYVITYSGDVKYSSCVLSGTLNVNNSPEISKLNPDLTVCVGDIVVGHPAIVNITVDERATGNVVVSVNGSESVVLISEGKCSLIVSDLAVGTYSVSARYVGDDSFNSSEMVVSFKVVDNGNGSGNVSLIVPEMTVSEFADGTGQVTLPSDATGEVTLTIDSKNYMFGVVNGIANVTLPNLENGNYSYTITYSGDGKYSQAKSEGIHEVNIAHPVRVPDVHIPDLNDALRYGYVIVTAPDDVKAMVILSISGKNHIFDVIDGKANVTLPDLVNGDYDYSIKYVAESKYANYTDIGILKVSKPSAQIIIPPFDEPSDDGSLTISFADDATGTVTLTIAKKDYIFNVIDGKAKVIIPDLGEGNYPYTITYSGDDKYASFTTEGIFNKTALVEPEISASDKSVLYTAGTYFKATVWGADGKLASNVRVVFKVNGKVFKTLNTTSEGIASFKVTQAPGTYGVQIESLGKAVTKTLKVKHLVTLKSVTVKKSAKKLVLTATLGKVNNKYLKNKPVTFKFNGKTYKAKTNSKGVAKVTIKSNVLKKLKVGKKLTYQATYSKDTVKKTVKIKK